MKEKLFVGVPIMGAFYDQMEEFLKCQGIRLFENTDSEFLTVELKENPWIFNNSRDDWDLHCASESGITLKKREKVGDILAFIPMANILAISTPARLLGPQRKPESTA